jgi:nuclear pore complex protein Nup93
LSHLVRECDVLNGEFQRTALQERQYAQGYLLADPESQAAVEVRKMIGDGAREYLEEQCVCRVLPFESLQSSRHFPQIHDVHRKDDRFASRRSRTRWCPVRPEQDSRLPQRQVPEERPVVQPGSRGGSSLTCQVSRLPSLTCDTSQIANNTPVWARIYYLLRSGHAKEALAFATENEAALQKLEKSFVPYFKAWLDSPDRRLPKLLRDRFLSEYNQRIRYLTDTSDPYKHALYKLIGRVEINRRNVPGVTQTTEDWLWFQLSLVRETEGQGEAPHEKYGLRDLAAVLLKFGEAHFDPKGTRPLLYFQVLLLSGQFERVGLLCFRAVCFLTVADFSTSTQAIAFLLQHSQYQADAVHFAIALAYYGLLRVPARGHAADVEFREFERLRCVFVYDLADDHMQSRTPRLKPRRSRSRASCTATLACLPSPTLPKHSSTCT